MSVTDPSPDLGWRGRERASLERRGTPELALCLAVVHHVCITGNVPVREFLDWLRSLDTALVIEFPDRADPMVQRLLSGKREGSNPDYERGGVRARARGAVRDRSQRAGVGDPDALRGAPAGVSGSIGFGRAALHLGGLWALAFAQPLFDLLGRNAEFFVARGSTTGRHPAAGVRLRAACRRWSAPASCGRWGGSGRRSAGRAMLVLVGADRRGAGAAAGRRRCSAARRSPIPVALARGRRRRRPVRARRRRALVRDGALARAADRAAPVPRRLAGARPAVPQRGRRRGRGPVALDDADRARRARRAAADHARRTRTGGSTPSCSRTSPGSRGSPPGTATRRRSTTSPTEAVPAQLTGEQPQPGSLPTDARPSAQPVHALRAQPRADGGRADHRRCARRGCATTSGRATVDRLRSLESDLEVVVQHLLLPEDLRDGLPGGRPRLGGVRDRLGDRLGRAARRREPAARRARAARPRRRDGRVRARDRVARAAGLAAAAAVPPLDAPARAVALPARRPPVSDRRARSTRGSRPRAGSGRSGRSTRAFQRHVLQVQYVDRLLGTAARRAARPRPVRRRGDRGRPPTTARRSSTGQPRRPVNRANVGVIAPVPFFVKLPGQRDGPRRRPRGADDRRAPDDRQGGRRARCRGRPTGCPADEREVDPDGADRRLARGRAGADRAARLRAGEAARARGRRGAAAARRRLRDRAAAGADRPPRRGAPGGQARDGRRRGAVLPSFVSGASEGLEPGHGARRRRQRARGGDDAGLPRRRTVGLRRARAAVVAARRARTPSRCSRCSRKGSCAQSTLRRSDAATAGRI